MDETDSRVPWPESIYPIITGSGSSVGCAVVSGSVASCVCNVPLKGMTVEPGETVQIPVWVRGPDEPGEHSVDFLFYYEPTVKIPHIRYVNFPNRYVFFFGYRNKLGFIYVKND